MNDIGSFGKYGKVFQEKIFQCLVADTTWASQIIEVMTPDFFEQKYLEYLTKCYFAYFEKYKSFPTMPLLITIVRDELQEGSDLILRDQIVEFLHRIKTNPDVCDLAYVKEKALDFCKRQSLKNALEDAVDLIATEKYDSVVTLMKEAISKGTPSTTGHNFFEDYDFRFSKINRVTCPTGIPQIDKKDILNGGLARGELGVVVAPTGVGKSHFLVHAGSEALRVGKNVIHYTFELSERAVGLRYDSNLCDIPSNEVVDRKDEIVEYYKDKDLGRLIIKEYPTGAASVLTIRNHIEKLLLKSFVPSLIIIDYADIMRSSRSYDSLRHELKLIYEELRNLAMDMHVPVWTASQANRDASNSDVVGLENMSEAYGKAMVADVVLSLSRKPLEKSTGTGRLFVAKNRAGRDGILFPIHLNTATSKLVVLDNTSEMSLNEVVSLDNINLKKTLKEKWKQINNDS
jgi:replicative DNA helicase|tara:strand:- start:23968 stop:25344 length:1377 start_codon:yes stop_codon:yes gene_type:complete